MRRVVLSFVAVLVVVVSGIVAKEEKEKAERVVMHIGPTIDLGGGVLYFPVGSMPVVMDKQDVGKPLSQIADPDTRNRVEDLATEMYGSLGDSANARRAAEKAMSDMPLTDKTKKKIADDFVNDFEELLGAGPRMPIYEPTADDCGFGQPGCSNCGTVDPLYPRVCYTYLACMNCGSVPK